MKEKCLNILNLLALEQAPQKPILIGEDIFYNSYDASYDTIPEGAYCSHFRNNKSRNIIVKTAPI